MEVLDLNKNFFFLYILNVQAFEKKVYTHYKYVNKIYKVNKKKNKNLGQLLMTIYKCIIFCSCSINDL